MKPDEVRKLLGGYATGTLTAQEKELLFAAALEDQSLFDALGDEEALRDLLAQPYVRQELIATLQPKRRYFAGWIPGLLAGAAALVLIGVSVQYFRRPAPQPVEMAMNKAPAAAVAAETPAPTPRPAQPAPQGTSVGRIAAPSRAVAERRGPPPPVAEPVAKDEPAPQPAPALAAAPPPVLKKAEPAQEAAAGRGGGGRAGSASESVTVLSQSQVLQTEQGPGASFRAQDALTTQNRMVAAPKIATDRTLDVKVTNWARGVVTLSAGTNAGLVKGRSLDLLREGKVIGRVKLTNVDATEAKGSFQPAPGFPDAPREGDVIRSR